ncbi:MAG: hypothetical protein E7614_05800 [Ruminococcaceae bacterium]|nr:hypothetical protein [Oscillospiraceae bacterium]
MRNILLLLSNTVSLYLMILFVFLMLRAIMSFFISETPSKPSLFIYSVTEPVVFPVRSFLMKFELFQSIPIDFSIMITALIINVLLFFV